jgi:hypothetical protein
MSEDQHLAKQNFRTHAIGAVKVPQSDGRLMSNQSGINGVPNGKTLAREVRLIIHHER